MQPAEPAQRAFPHGHFDFRAARGSRRRGVFRRGRLGCARLDPAAHGFLFVLGQRRHAGVLAGHVLLENHVVKIGLFRVPAHDVVRVCGDPFEVENVAEFSFRPRQFRPVAVHAFRLENLAHLARQPCRIGVRLRCPAAQRCEQERERAGEKKSHRECGMMRPRTARFLGATPSRGTRSFFQTASRYRAASKATRKLWFASEPWRSMRPMSVRLQAAHVPPARRRAEVPGGRIELPT